MTAEVGDAVRTRGFAIVPGFLDAAEVARLVDDHAQARASEVDHVSTGVLAQYVDKVGAISTQASAMDLVRNGLYFDTRRESWPWHTDAVAYYLYPEFLLCWITLAKPDRRRSGIQLIAFDDVTAANPELAAWLRGRGATRTFVRGDTRVFHDSARREMFPLRDVGLLDRIATTPEVGPGDLVIMRNDVLHRTQDVETERLAVSFRVVDGASIVRRAQLLDMGSAKFGRMARNRNVFARRLAAFQLAGRDEMTGVEYEALCRTIEARELAMQQALGVARLREGHFENLIYSLERERKR